MSTPDLAAALEGLSLERTPWDALHGLALDVTPWDGRLVSLRTKDEVRASLETVSAYVVETPARFANAVKDAIQTAVPDLKTSEFSHLRRVVQYKYLPPHLQKSFYPPTRLPRGDEDTSPPSAPSQVSLELSSAPPSPSSIPTSPATAPLPDQEDGTVEDVSTEDLDTVRYFLLCPTRYIQHADLLDTLRRNPPFNTSTRAPRIFYVTVPGLAPTSQEQSDRWTEQYWPIAYKNTNPFGPHPSLVARNAAEIEAEAGTWLALASCAGTQISEAGFGEKIGCVVVDRTRGTPEIIAVAGDSRWRSPVGLVEEKDGCGNAMAHAVERAIAIVAKKRLRSAGKDPSLLDRSLFCDNPLTDVEQQFFEKANLPSNGYLCVDLDIYMTHEPCVMCSMAILHSRFRRCVIGKRMPLTGGMSSDTAKGNGTTEAAGLAHGIFWRPSELNWKFLAWEWKGAEGRGKERKQDGDIADTLQV
ncbi:cytidine deaminase-like protein [Massariosphaeria phaeospora]|uniref:Cytidine deaminase-like protein n=1 Tax=Massariosphaeria phaeospora TaxID=100035 RepID=A0A7C8M792_9PLEO|nr:cytidine deaminase-like protein [Massariosphaeria phaeospora]